MSGDGNKDKDDSVSNLNKYLSFNNIWTVEKLASEFKTIHANRVSYVQT
jgi:hypothetical protein